MIQTDYLVVGTGAAGMGFVDALLEDSDSRVVMVDRRHAPGGHWHDAYPFVRLHMPSAFYGVESTPLGHGRVQQGGLDDGLHERAGGPEVCAYYDRVMQERLIASGRVLHFPLTDYLGDRRFRSLVTGEVHEVEASCKVVDGTYLETAIPAKTPPPFEVGDDVWCVPINALASMREAAAGYVVIGSGKTAMDACLWLIANGTSPAEIRWIRPRDCWLLDRSHHQPGTSGIPILGDLGQQLKAAAESDTIDEVFERIEDAGVLSRLDTGIWPTMMKGALASRAEIEELRRIDQVVRLGHVRRIEADQIVLDEGSIPTTPGHLHVHCATPGLRLAAPVPIFEDGRITLQNVRMAVPCFNAALLGRVEASGRDDAEKNRLCPPNAYPDTPLDWLRMLYQTMLLESMWAPEADISGWAAGSRLNMMRRSAESLSDPQMQGALQTLGKYLRPGLAKIEEFLAAADGPERERIYPPVAAA
jgi:hypothetical protein